MNILSKQKGFALKTLIIGILLLFIGCIILILVMQNDIKSFLRHYNNIDNSQQQKTGVIQTNKDEPQELSNEFENTSNQNTFLSTESEIIQNSNSPLSEVHGAGDKSHLVKVPSKYTNKDELVHQDVLAPAIALIEAAKKDGIKLSIFSAYRSYTHQKSIWERKWGDSANDDVSKARNILQYSSFPGTSRHHWGTDIDFNSVSLEYWDGNEGRKIHQWLKTNAPKYGFCQVYGEGRNGQGYNNEPWHWSHIGTANHYYHQIVRGQTLGVALSQNVLGINAVKSISSELMNYITSISSCSISSGGDYTSKISEEFIQTEGLTLKKLHPANLKS